MRHDRSTHRLDCIVALPLPRRAIVAQLRLGLPMGAAILIEAGFSFVAFLIARHSSADAVAGRQLAANLVSMMFMLPLALANGTATLVAQRIGARHARSAAPGMARRRDRGWGPRRSWARWCTWRENRCCTSTPATRSSLLRPCRYWWGVVVSRNDAAQTLANFMLRSHRVT